MTTTPIGSLLGSLVPGQAGASAGQSGTPGSTADAFLALVQGLLDGAEVQPTGDPAQVTVPAPATGPTTVAGPVAGPVTGPVTGPLVGPAIGSVAVDLTGKADLADGKPVAEDAEPVELPTIAVPDFAAAAAAVVPVLPTPTVQAQPTASVPEAATAPATTAAVATVAAPAKPAPIAATTTTDKADDTTAPTAAPDTATANAELPGIAVTRVEHRPATTEQGSPAPAPTVAPISGPAPVSSAAAVATAPTDTHRVAQQVFPEVVKVSSNPGGPQRVTIKLNPEALGEVRVVLTSRGGGLEVSMSAGKEARAALAAGAPELQRLLDNVGRGDSRIIVRDLLGTLPGTTVSSTQPTAASSGSGLPMDFAGGAGTGAGRPGSDSAAGQQSRNHQNFGATDGAQGTTNPSRPTDSVTRAQPGLDVTM